MPRVPGLPDTLATIGLLSVAIAIPLPLTSLFKANTNAEAIELIRNCLLPRKDLISFIMSSFLLFIHFKTSLLSNITKTVQGK
jgi:hypothetical protein